jgi:hypothetical protein
VIAGRCACAHTYDGHLAGGPCLVELVEDLAAELPAWRCPCRRYRLSFLTSHWPPLTVRDRTVDDAPLAV